MVPVGRPRWLQLLEQQGARPRGGGGRWRRNPVPPFAEGMRVVVRVAMRGGCVVNYAVREVGRGAPLVLGELVASAAASSVRVPSTSLVRSRRHLGRGGGGSGAGPPRGGRGGRGGERYPGVVVSRDVVVQGVVSITAALRAPDARVSVEEASLPTVSAVRSGISKMAALAASAAALLGAGVKTCGTADSCTAVPVVATAAATTLLDTEKTCAVATAAAGSCTTVSTLATAVPTALRGANAEAYAAATATAGSCTTVATLATAVQ